MSTRAVDLQALLFRLQDVQQIQTNGQQQPQVTQSQFSQMFVSHVEEKREQIQNPNPTEGTIIREKGESERRGGQRRRQRREPPEKEKQNAPVPYSTSSHIDVWV